MVRHSLGRAGKTSSLRYGRISLPFHPSVLLGDPFIHVGVSMIPTMWNTACEKVLSPVSLKWSYPTSCNTMEVSVNTLVLVHILILSPRVKKSGPRLAFRMPTNSSTV